METSLPLHVRRATAADLPALASMGAALARFHAELDPRRFMDPEGFEEGYRSWFARELKRREVCLLVAADPRDNSIAGYCYGRLSGPDWASLLDEHAALIDVWVRPEKRQHGAGEGLVRAFCAWAAGKAPRVVLSTAVQNRAAQALFEKTGFRSTMIEMTRESDAAEQ